MKTLRRLGFYAFVLLAVCSCKGNRGNTRQTGISGDDRDTRGCIGSAGYTWSAVLGRCIRPFEEGEKLLPVKVPEDGSAILAAFAVFSPDSARAEVFLPQDENPLALERLAHPPGASHWDAVSERDAYSLRKEPTGQWILLRQNDRGCDTLYRSK